MADHVLFLTGKLARSRLEKVLAQLTPPPFEWAIADMGVKVAALMTEAIILRRLDRGLVAGATRIVVPGRCRADLDRLASEFGRPFERGPDEVRDIPEWLGQKRKAPLLAEKSVRIFAEIVEAPLLECGEIMARAAKMREQGADVIDLGCLPDTPFPHLQETVQALKAQGFLVSVDSASTEELRSGAEAGADFVLSLTEKTLELVAGTGAMPIVISSRHGDLDDLVRVGRKAARQKRALILDPILDPIHFGLVPSLLRYAQLRQLLPEAEIMMGTGNLTELTEADTPGITAILMGICSELAIRNVLVVQVSPHTRRTIAEHAAAARLMHAAKADGALPKGYGAGLVQLHDLKPFTTTSEEIDTLAKSVRDDNFRIETALDGIHVYNRDGHHVGTDAMSLFAKLNVVTDGPHAFYLGTELMKAEVALKLGKRYAQDSALDWGCGADRQVEDLNRSAEAGPTLQARPASEKGKPCRADHT
ncbi:MAG: dihydropteroate synthase [Hyphomicrobiales bacterium]|nr:dihydropteroate synthase [Hyphomicrobiales bacterium]MBV9113483.1 dihydropteroate synthase [Hyphomicrobiales bacterium]MBV9520918.1 dihydropteroate synthase [Hyphomicrobiales bacterium]